MRIVKSLLLLATAILSLTACGTDNGHGSSPQGVAADGLGIKAEPRQARHDADALPESSLAAVGNTVPSDWIRISAGEFSFSIPPDMVERDVQGIDSYVGSYRNSSIDLNFDYGMYCAPAQDPDELIDGKRARITDEDRVSDVRGVRYGNNSCVHFEDIGRPGVNLSMCAFGKSSADQATARIIFRSIYFE